MLEVSYTRKVKITAKDTEECINGCYLLMTIQINEIGDYVPDYIFYIFSIIVKITSKETGLSIYRIWKGTPLYVESKDTLFVDDSAKYALIKTKEANKVNLVLSKGSRLKFYWNHFDNATRISFKLGLTSVFLGALSIIMALPYNCIKIWFGNFLQLFFGG